MTQVCLGNLLRAEIATDRCNVHRLPASWVVDSEAVHQEGDWRLGSEMHETKLSLPSAGTRHQKPNFVPHSLPVSPRNEIKQMKSQRRRWQVPAIGDLPDEHIKYRLRARRC